MCENGIIVALRCMGICKEEMTTHGLRINVTVGVPVIMDDVVGRGGKHGLDCSLTQRAVTSIISPRSNSLGRICPGNQGRYKLCQPP